MLTPETSYIDQLRAMVPLHPPTVDCPDLECLVCGIRDCPHGEPLHYHHDGCPSCYEDLRTQVTTQE